MPAAERATMRIVPPRCSVLYSAEAGRNGDKAMNSAAAALANNHFFMFSLPVFCLVVGVEEIPDRSSCKSFSSTCGIWLDFSKITQCEPLMLSCIGWTQAGVASSWRPEMISVGTLIL